VKNWKPIKFEPEAEQAYARHMIDRLIPLARLSFMLGIGAFIGYQYWDLLLDPLALSKTGPLRLMAVCLMIVCIGLTYLPTLRVNPGYWYFVVLVGYFGVAIILTLIFSRLPGGLVAGVGAITMSMVFVTAITSGALQASVVLVTFLGTTIVVMIFTGASNFELINMLAWGSGGITFVTGNAYLLDVINRQAFQLERQLENEKQRSDTLLLNILPEEIASRLKAQEEPLADSHENVSVLFADLAGFTNISRKLSAADLVNLLNDLFSRFDKLAKKHNAEKIKTIGDCYMVATGLSGNTADHAANIVDLALGMQRAFSEFRALHGIDLKLRIGVHSGAVIAGVIGKQKFSYDLWGNTVNVASRMESEGIPDKIQISEETREMLPNHYEITPRGEIQIKGHRPRETYLLNA
jgi:adenylate cyclase